MSGSEASNFEPMYSERETGSGMCTRPTRSAKDDQQSLTRNTRLLSSIRTGPGIGYPGNLSAVRPTLSQAFDDTGNARAQPTKMLVTVTRMMCKALQGFNMRLLCCKTACFDRVDDHSLMAVIEMTGMRQARAMFHAKQLLAVRQMYPGECISKRSLYMVRTLHPGKISVAYVGGEGITRGLSHTAALAWVRLRRSCPM